MEFGDIPINSMVQEIRRRKRELAIIFGLSFIFVFLIWFEVRLFGISQQLPFVHSIFFFGLVNFNIVLLLLLFFLIFRNIVKVFVERRGRVFGSSLKVKLVAAFFSFSTVPTLLMFVISVVYINTSFDKWFSVKMVGVLKSSLEVQKEYYFNFKKKNYHFAHEVAQSLQGVSGNVAIKSKLSKLQKEFSLDAVEYYPTLLGERVVSLSKDENLLDIPPVSLEFLQKGIRSQVESSTIHQFGEGNLVRVIVPVKEGEDRGAVVVSSFVPLSIISRMNDVSEAYEEFKDINPIEYPLKSIYVIVLFLITMVILFAASWFGFHLAKQLSIPLVQLGRATQKVAEGDYSPLEVNSGSEEITSLLTNFNQMTDKLATSQKQISEANAHLGETLRYIEVVLKNVSAGVISVDSSGKITTINRHASELLDIEPAKYIGHSVRELLTLEYFRVFADLLKTMVTHKLETLQREFKVQVKGQTLPLMINLSLLKDETGHEIGKILVFDDMTPIVSAQRSAAWTEVARRIAHEIKNPLTPIKLSAERLQRKFGSSLSDPAFEECTRMIIQQVDEMKLLVNEFTQFARLPQAKPVVAQVNEIATQASSLFRQAHTQVEIVENLDPNMPPFKFDPEQIKRSLINLIDNAVAACHSVEGAQIRVQTQYDPELLIAKIVVADNGPGISPSERQRIFEPYYSTKETGTGLGLAIVKRIIEDHSGFIRAIANEPNGLQMVIELPVHAVEQQIAKTNNIG